MITAHRGKIAHCLSDPATAGDAGIECFEDGALLIDNGHVAALGPADAVLARLSPDMAITEHGEDILLPGFIDCHVHYPQIDVVASFGTQLLEWLERYTFPAEAAFADKALADEHAAFFIDELLKNGTTTALVFATVHAHSADAIFAAAARKNLRLAAGKVLMDRNCPPELQDTATTGYTQSRALIEKWHGQNRLLYAITPRFAVTSSPDQLAAAGRLAAEFPDVLVHTHLAENLDEVEQVAKLFPDARSYLDVYQNSGLVRDRAVFAHCLHLHDEDLSAMAHAHAGIAFCPTSNTFLGSGLFDLSRIRNSGIDVGLGTDIGGGTSFSLLATMAEAYKVAQLQQQTLSSAAALYLATLGAAKTLGIEDKVGNFALGKEADFVVLDAAPTALLARRLRGARNMAEALFAHMMLGDDRSIRATYILGEAAYRKDGQPRP